MQPLVEVTRGPLVETRHRGVIAVVDASGRLLWRAGDPGALVTYWRSSAKPFQSMPIVYTGAARRYGYESADLAIFSASHNAEPVHQEQVTAALARAGLDPGLLRCGGHLPTDKLTAEQMQAGGEKPTALHNNCSGKHTGMLALAAHLGYPTAGYLEPDHPVQQIIIENLAAVLGISGSSIALGVDGCGVPTFGISVCQMALAFARLADPPAIPAAPGDAPLPAGYAPPDAGARRDAARQVRDAMMAHPYLVAGRRRLDTDLMQVLGSRAVCKTGASGVYSLGILPEAVRALPALAGAAGGVGVAIKIEDGQSPQRDVAVVETLVQLGLLGPQGNPALEYYRRTPVHNVAGRLVGEMRPAFRLEPGV